MPDQILYFNDSELPEQLRNIPDEIYRAIRSGLTNGKIITIEYEKQPGKVQKRDILPEVLFRYFDGWYVAAYCYLREDARTFRLDRIRSAEETGKMDEPTGIAEEYRKNGIPWEQNDCDSSRKTSDWRHLGLEVAAPVYHPVAEKDKQIRRASYDLLTHVEMNRIDLVEEDLAAGADINFDKGYGSTALTAAVSLGYLEMFQFLLSRGADITRKTAGGDSVLFCAVRNYRRKLIRYLVTEWDCDPNEKNVHGITPFTAAAQNLDLDTMQYLLKRGADIHTVDREQCSVLQLVLKSHSPDITEKFKTLDFLIEHGAEIHSLDKKNQNVLFYAVRSVHPEFVNYFLLQGADVNCRDIKGNSLLHIVLEVFNNNVLGEWTDEKFIRIGKIICLLCDAGIYLDSSNKKGIVPLMLAKYDVFDYLLQRGADPLAKDIRGRTVALFHADNLQHIDKLVERGVDLFERDQDGNTVLMMAPMEQKYLKYYIENYGFSPCEQNHLQSILHRAVQETSVGAVIYLLEHGADALQKDQYNRTARQMINQTGRIYYGDYSDAEGDLIEHLLFIYENRQYAEILRACCTLDLEKLKTFSAEVLTACIKDATFCSGGNVYSVSRVVLRAWNEALPSFSDERIEAIFDLLIAHGMNPVNEHTDDHSSLIYVCLTFGKRFLAEKYLTLWLSGQDSPKDALNGLLKRYNDPSLRLADIRSFLKQKLAEFME